MPPMSRAARFLFLGLGANLVIATDHTVTATNTVSECAASCYTTITWCAETTSSGSQSSNAPVISSKAYMPGLSSSFEQSYTTASESSSAASASTPQYICTDGNGCTQSPTASTNFYDTTPWGASTTAYSSDHFYVSSVTDASSELPVTTDTQGQTTTGYSSTKDICERSKSSSSHAYTSQESTDTCPPSITKSYSTAPYANISASGTLTSNYESSASSSGMTDTTSGPSFPTITLSRPITQPSTHDYSSQTISYESSADAIGTTDQETQTYPPPTTFVTNTRAASSEELTTSTNMPPSYGNPTGQPPSYGDPPSYLEPPSFESAVYFA